MSTSGRYFVTAANGRRFCVEPVEGRVNESKSWRVGGADDVRGGATTEAESIITESNGFTHIKTLPPSVSPEDYIAELLSRPTSEKKRHG